MADDTTKCKILAIRDTSGAKYLRGQRCATLPGKSSQITELTYQAAVHALPDDEGYRAIYPACVIAHLADGDSLEIPYHRIEWVLREAPPEPEKEPEPEQEEASPPESAD